ncbi:hypothetical protein ACQEWB_48650 [Streptomyces sp. CA-249302]|uniref:hypothetical protein n=1 Tax=Streptomyces sp. CA-249302 TaxID=3240058 RepID=UPI003D8C3CC8
MTSVAQPAAAIGSPRAASATTAVTLITGDRFRLDADGGLLSFEPAKGREDIGFRVEDTGEHLYVIPSDAERLIARGTVDPSLFDLKTLLNSGYDDAHQDKLSLIVGGTVRSGFSADRLGSRPVPDGTVVTRRLPAVRGAAVAVDKKAAGTLWRSLTRPSGSPDEEAPRSTAPGSGGSGSTGRRRPRSITACRRSARRARGPPDTPVRASRSPCSTRVSTPGIRTWPAVLSQHGTSPAPPTSSTTSDTART